MNAVVCPPEKLMAQEGFRISGAKQRSNMDLLSNIIFIL